MIINMVQKSGHPLLQRQHIGMRISNDQDIQVIVLGQCLQKALCTGAKLDEVLDLSLQRHDVDVKMPGPVIGAVPIHRALSLTQGGLNMGGGQFLFQTVNIPVSYGQVVYPEMVVETQVQQSAIHVQKQGVDIIEAGVVHVNDSIVVVMRTAIRFNPLP